MDPGFGVFLKVMMSKFPSQICSRILIETFSYKMKIDQTNNKLFCLIHYSHLYSYFPKITIMQFKTRSLHF